MRKHTSPIAIGFILLVHLLSTQTFADVAPDPGYERISLKLIVESQDEFPDYRFFIKSGADLKEIVIKKGARTVVEPMGGGAYYRAGTFLAVPKKNLTGLSEAQSNDKLSELQKTIYDGKVVGTIELVKHSFAREVSILEASGWKDPVYRIEADPQAGLKAVHVSGGANESKTDSNVSSGLRFWQSAAAAIVAGIFLLFGLAIAGIWYFRKSSKAV